MSRLVRKPRPPGLDPQTSGFDDIFGPGFAAPQKTEAVSGDNYLERAVKYIPAEILGGSMVINAILQQAMISGGPDARMAGFPITTVATVALIVGLILTPLFCWYVRQDGDAWITNAVVSTVAFPFWAYLTGAVAFADYHDGNLAAILILTFTAVSGLVTPLPQRVKRQEEHAVATEPAVAELTLDQPPISQPAAPPPKEGPRLVEPVEIEPPPFATPSIVNVFGRAS